MPMKQFVDKKVAKCNKLLRFEPNTKTDYPISLNSYVQGQITAKKCGNVVYVNGMVYFNSDYKASEWKSIASGFPAPSELIYVGNQIGYMRVNQSGVLEIYPPVTGNVQIPFNFTYLIN